MSFEGINIFIFPIEFVLLLNSKPYDLRLSCSATFSSLRYLKGQFSKLEVMWKYNMGLITVFCNCRQHININFVSKAILQVTQNRAKNSQPKSSIVIKSFVKMCNIAFQIKILRSTLMI